MDRLSPGARASPDSLDEPKTEYEKRFFVQHIKRPFRNLHLLIDPPAMTETRGPRYYRINLLVATGSVN